MAIQAFQQQGGPRYMGAMGIISLIGGIAAALIGFAAGASAGRIAAMWDEETTPPWRWPVSVFSGAALAVFGFFVLSTSETGTFATLLAAGVFAWLLLSLSLIDAHTWRLPDPLTAATAITGLGAALLLSPEPFWAHVLGGVLGYGVLRLIAEAYYRLRGHEGLGLGDAKLLGAIGCWVGWTNLPFVVSAAAFAALLAIAAFGVLHRKRVERQDALPFGPFLALGGWLVWLAGMS